eukprot:CAMPEP_0197659302 /NCGR_PEP_ID=MMETSP1338-20131121/47120_1 /TAXON_ID=43686 ORGANISM="Pelagodinium beii, Strain RCC1491" /NCGR_SAMPLE_ID=MMETSP1338 /ASSEMBLY_ACC=CAM_ASM_000754 /LENGTH=273 /DNA_ID=CAMNT_0043236167 /DNA_START=37 /DNA_END=858 /DNA_ORIENTATION=+
MAAVLLLFSALPQVLGQALRAPVCAVEGHAYDDPTVTVMNGGIVEDASDCQAKCAESVDCAFFSFFSNTKGCWLQSKDAKVRDPPADFDVYATSGPSKCANGGVSNWQKPTIAPGIQITANGVVLGAEDNATSDATASESKSQDAKYSFYDYVDPSTTYADCPRVLWFCSSWWLLAAAALVAFIICSCICCKGRDSRAPKTRGIALEEDEEEASEAGESAKPLMQNLQTGRPVDAGLMRPQLMVPELPVPQLVSPQIMPMPAAQGSYAQQRYN